MSPKSLSLSFRLPLAFHCLNNEGGSGNVMEPRRITIREAEYDGISGEMARRHVLENFVRLCGERNIPLTDACKGLAPERGKEALKAWIDDSADVRKEKDVKQFEPGHYNAATNHLLSSCALSDLGGFLIPFGMEDKIKGTLKRDSCFEFSWLITEHPAIVEFTQQVAYRADPSQNAPFTQNMRVGIYSGVFRFDLARVGVSDWAWLSPNSTASVIDDAEKQRRILALLDALEQWLLSPSGARQAGWLQHQDDLREGIFCLSNNGPAPFISPLKLDLQNQETPVMHNPAYREELERLAEKRPGRLECVRFDGLAGLAEAFDTVRARIGVGAK